MKYRKLLFFAGSICMALILVACVKRPKENRADNMIDQSRGLTQLEMDQYSDAPSDTSAQGMKEVASNDNYILYVDPITTDIAVFDKKTDMYTHSNPAKGDGASLNDVQLAAYSSLVGINFTNLANKDNKYNSYTDSVVNEQFEFYKIDNGIRIVFTLGLDESKRILPPTLSEETYQKLMDQLSDDEKADVKPLYRLLKTESLQKSDKEGMIAKYPRLATDNLYILRQLKKYDKALLEGILKAHDFTLEDVQSEIEYAGIKAVESVSVFHVPLDLWIDDNGLLASVDLSYIENANEFKVTEVTILRGFGATTNEDGFILLPDGSGILFDLVSTESNIYSKQIYGADQSIAAPYKTGFYMQGNIPVFGIRNSNQAIFAIIEEGAALANIVACSKSPTSPVACVSPEFTVNAKDYQNYGGLKTAPSGLVLPSDTPVATTTIRYFFINEENVTYSQMAKLYQNYLVENGTLRKQDKTEEITPFYIEMPGAIERMVARFGIPMNTTFALTSYKQAEEIMKMLMDEGVRGIHFRYTGWINNGIYNSVMNKVDFIKSLGSKKDFDQLLSFTKSNEIDVFLEANFPYVYKDKSFDGFKYTKDASRQLDHTVSVNGIYDPASLKMNNYGKSYIVSPRRIPDYADSFFNDYTNKGIKAGISLGVMGKNISSDYKLDAVITRERSEEYYREVFQKAKEAGDAVLTEAGNSYTWDYVSDIVSLPVGGSELYSQKQAIPFVQMVLHGYIDYAGLALNLSSDLTFETLKAIETGSGIYAQMMYAEDMVVVDTVYDYMYSLNYKNQLTDIAHVYNMVAAVLDQVADATMVTHERLTDGVYAVTYSNGKRIIVNYNQEAYIAGNILVEARNYTVLEVNNK